MASLIRERVLVWQGVGEFRAEVCHAHRTEGRLTARGTQLGVEPLPYRLDYRLRTGPDFVTEMLDVEAAGEGWRRRVQLYRSPGGDWSCESEQEGDVDLPAPGGDTTPFAEALDCDLGLCPLTNTMPVLRHGLAAGGGEPHDFVMAWISVPDLGVHRSEQRYEPVGPGRVRYVGKHRDFVGELELDADGFVVHYPELAERVA